MKMLKVLLAHYLGLALLFFIGRAGLILLYFDRVEASGVAYGWSFLYGVRMDLIAASMLLAPMALMLTLWPSRYAELGGKIIRGYGVLILSLSLFVEIATFPFFAQYDVRPNYKFVEYLVYPKEVISLLLSDYKLLFLFAVAAIVLAGRWYLRRTRGLYESILKESGLWPRALWILPFALIIVMGIRSSFGHRPANISDALYSSSRLVNEITKNSLHSIFSAIKANQGDPKVSKRYGKMPIKEALARFDRLLNIRGNDLNSSSPFSRIEKSHFSSHQKPINLVIFLQESLGYQFVSPRVTPNLYRLKEEGIWFDQLYSNSTRSVRGIAGVTSGIFSIPGKALLKRNKSQEGVFTFSSLLRPLGYHTMFLYGGEARFDNMRGWMLGNGFEEVIEQKDYAHPAFEGTWGVSDEDLVDMALKRFDRLDREGRPFAALMFSSSNHTPFEYPEGRISPIEGEPLHGVKNAVKYADYAIGRFIQEARKRPWYAHTVIAIVADHNVRVYGDEAVPVKMFHIPGLILGGGVHPDRFDKLATQPDLLATALDLLGKDFRYPILGHSIYSDDKRHLNLIKFNGTYALRIGEKVAVIRPGKKPQTFRYAEGSLRPAPHDREMEKDLLAAILSLDYLYRNKAFR